MSMLAHRTHILKSVALARLCFLIEHCEITHPTGFAGMLILTHRTHMLKAIAWGDCILGDSDQEALPSQAWPETDLGI